MSRGVEGGALALGPAQLVRTEEGFRLDYEVAARGPEPLWLWTLFETVPSGRYRLAPTRAYVELHAPGTVVLSKALWPVPPEVQAEFPEVPCLLRLEPGRTCAGRVEVSLPVRTSHPYAQGRAAPLAPEQLQRLELRIGYLPCAPDLELHRGVDVEGQAFAYPDYAPALQLQRVSVKTLVLEP